MNEVLAGVSIKRLTKKTPGIITSIAKCFSKRRADHFFARIIFNFSCVITITKVPTVYPVIAYFIKDVHINTVTRFRRADDFIKIDDGA